MNPLNAEFGRLLHKSGWNQATAAAQLKVSPSAISQYLSGTTAPSMPVIKLFKLMLNDTQPIPGLDDTEQIEMNDRAAPLDIAESTLITELREMEDPQRKAFIAHMRGIAAMLPKRKVSYSKKAR